MSSWNTKTEDLSNFDAGRYYDLQAPAETDKYMLQQTMLRVKNPKVSLDFYTSVLGQLPRVRFLKTVKDLGEESD